MELTNFKVKGEGAQSEVRTAHSTTASCGSSQDPSQRGYQQRATRDCNMYILLLAYIW